MTLTIDVPVETMTDIKREVENEIRESITDEEVFNIIGDPKEISFMSLLAKARLHDRYTDMDMDLKFVGELTREEKVFLMTKWMYDYIIGD